MSTEENTAPVIDWRSAGKDRWSAWVRGRPLYAITLTAEEAPGPGDYFMITRISLGPRGGRDLGGACSLELAKAIVAEDAKTVAGV